jgi:hypothetical protein
MKKDQKVDAIEMKEKEEERDKSEKLKKRGILDLYKYADGLDVFMIVLSGYSFIFYYINVCNIKFFLGLISLKEYFQSSLVSLYQLLTSFSET